MEIIFILIAAVAPALYLLYSINDKDKDFPEPKTKIAKGFFYGILSALIALFIGLFTEPFVSLFYEPYVPVISQVATAFIEAAIPEECAKLFMLWLLLRNNKHFDEYLDGVVYAISVSMGFAAFENILYLLYSDEWVSTGIVRALVSVPGHNGFAILMGYFYSLYHYSKNKENKRLKYMIIVAPVLAHAIFDALLMVAQLSESLGFIIMIAFFVFTNNLRKTGQKRIFELIHLDKSRINEGL